MAAAGHIGNANRSRPYGPSFNTSPARSTLPAVGASVCASGSQVCSGNSGVFTPNPTRNAANTQHCSVKLMCCAAVYRSGRWNVQ